jgi:hypothetical protein
MLFRVEVEGERSRLTVDGEWVEVGFYAIRHVLARSPEEAKQCVRRKMERERRAGRVDDSDVRLRVEEMQASHRYRKLLRQDGVVFFRVESAAQLAEEPPH